MNVAITGASGLVGSSLAAALNSAGDQVNRITRGSGDAARRVFFWDPDAGRVDDAALAGCDAVVHLAGENIAARRWNAAQKARIRTSRVKGTRTLVAALVKQDAPVKTLVCASAIGFYGNRGDEELSEAATAGTGYLPEVCQAWEAETEPAAERGIRVVCLRIGVVLSAEGGALAKMLLPFRLGAGGVLGSGRQYMSWIDLDDLVGAIRHVLKTETLRGPVNAVSPQPVSNREFTKTLGRVLRRPTIAPMPAFAARLAFGEMAEALLLASTRVVPTQLAASGYVFQHPTLESSLRRQLDR